MCAGSIPMPYHGAENFVSVFEECAFLKSIIIFRGWKGWKCIVITAVRKQDILLMAVKSASLKELFKKSGFRYLYKIYHKICVYDMRIVFWQEIKVWCGSYSACYYFFFFICLGVSNAGLQRAQNHFPLGFWLNPTHPKWNHSIGHWISMRNEKYKHEAYVRIVASDHFPVANLMTKTVSWFVWIDGHV